MDDGGSQQLPPVPTTPEEYCSSEVFLANFVQDVNTKVDGHGLSYAKKIMIRCSFSLDVNGIWHIGQLFPHLPEIVRNNGAHFDGKPAPEILA